MRPLRHHLPRDLAAYEACQRLGVPCLQLGGGRDVRNFRRHGKALRQDRSGERHAPAFAAGGISKLLVDEKSVRKGHGYVTVVLNGETGELLHMAEGKKKESLESFFEKLTEAQRAGIVAVGIDRAGSYQSAVETWLPNADIVYDRFHLVANVSPAVDEVRRGLCRQADKAEGKVLKGKRFLVLANQDKLDADGATKLAELLAVCRPFVHCKPPCPGGLPG